MLLPVEGQEQIERISKNDLKQMLLPVEGQEQIERIENKINNVLSNPKLLPVKGQEQIKKIPKNDLKNMLLPVKGREQIKKIPKNDLKNMLLPVKGQEQTQTGNNKTQEQLEIIEEQIKKIQEKDEIIQSYQEEIDSTLKHLRAQKRMISDLTTELNNLRTNKDKIIQSYREEIDSTLKHLREQTVRNSILTTKLNKLRTKKNTIKKYEYEKLQKSINESIDYLGEIDNLKKENEELQRYVDNLKNQSNILMATDVPIATEVKVVDIPEQIEQNKNTMEINEDKIKYMTQKIKDFIQDDSPNFGIEDQSILEPPVFIDEINPELVRGDYYNFECGGDDEYEFNFENLLKEVNCYAEKNDKKPLPKNFLYTNQEVEAIREISNSKKFVKRMNSLVNTPENFNKFFQYLTSISNINIDDSIKKDLKRFKDFFDKNYIQDITHKTCCYSVTDSTGENTRQSRRSIYNIPRDPQYVNMLDGDYLLPTVNKNLREKNTTNYKKRNKNLLKASEGYKMADGVNFNKNDDYVDENLPEDLDDVIFRLIEDAPNWEDPTTLFRNIDSKNKRDQKITMEEIKIKINQGKYTPKFRQKVFKILQDNENVIIDSKEFKNKFKKHIIINDMYNEHLSKNVHDEREKNLEKRKIKNFLNQPKIIKIWIEKKLSDELINDLLEKYTSEGKVIKVNSNTMYDHTDGDDFSPITVVKRKFGKKKVSKIPLSLKKLCKKLGVRMTTKRKGKRVYKSTKVLKEECRRKGSFGKKKVSKIPLSLKKLCKKLGVRMTTKRKGKRVYKSTKVLKGECRRKGSFGKKKVSKIPLSLKKLCKKLGVRMTMKRKGKRVYKSTKVLKRECKKYVKNKKK